MPRRSCPSWRNGNRNKCFRIREVEEARSKKKRKKNRYGLDFSIRQILSRKFLDRPLAFMTKNFEVISFQMPFRGRRGRGIIRVLLPSSLTRGKGLNNVTRHKGQVSCAARHSWHFCEKRIESPSVASLFPFPATSSGVHVVRENLSRRFNFVYSGMLLKKKEEDRGSKPRERGERIVARGLQQKPVNRLRHVDDTTKEKAVNFKLLF